MPRFCDVCDHFFLSPQIYFSFANGTLGMKPITEEWGIEVQNVNLKDISFDAGMQRAMAKKAEAERLREAKIIHAESEVQTAAKVCIPFFSLYSWLALSYATLFLLFGAFSFSNFVFS